MSNKCSLCGKEFDVDNLANAGGSALMFTFAYRHTTHMFNISHCPECAEKYVLPVIRKMKADLCLDTLELDE